MSKPPAKKAIPKKSAAPKAIAPVAAKQKAAATKKTVAKPVAKPVAEPIAKLGTKKPAAPPVKTPSASPAAAKSVAKPAAKVIAKKVHQEKPVPKATPAPAPAKTKPAASAKSKAAPVAVQQPTAAPAPVTNRFTDRFAPAVKPVSRPPTETAELPKPAQKIDPKLANAWKTKAGRELTEPELLAMPESEYMNDKQLDFFRVRLLQHRDDLLSNAGETTEHLREDTTIVPDPADRATIEEEHALELRTRDRERKLLKKVAQAIALLDTGEYGYCDETSEPIGLPRLLARPTATLSLEAQQRRELKQKMFGN